MDDYDYLIIGGGMVADAAVRGIREIDLSGRIGIMSQETFPPYARPPLTKGLWYGKPLDDIWLQTEKEKVVLHLSTTITSINPEEHTAKDAQGQIYKYKKLLLATGGIPRRLDCIDEGVLYFRTLQDYYKLREFYDRANHFIILGGGYIGTELASALSMNGKKVTLIFKEKTLQSQKFPKKFSSFLNAYFTEKEVQLVPQQRILSVTNKNTHYTVKTSDGEEYEAECVLAGLGIEPNLQLAHILHLELDNGIKVNGLLQTSHKEIWAAGDVANFYSPHLDKRVRIEHEDAAISMGKQAGRNMAGAFEDYTYLPYFYSDVFELSYEAIGEISSDMEIVEEWVDLYRQGALYYLKEGKLCGALFINTWNKIPQAREWIASQQPFSSLSII